MKLKNIILILGCVFLSSCSSLFRALKITPSQKITEVEFSNDVSIENYQFYYSDTLENLYLRKLRHNYGLDSLTFNLPNEVERIKKILDWSSSQWEHNGSNTPSKSDALTILEEAKSGKQFRCVEYGILATLSLNSIGIPAKVLALKTSDVEKVKFGAGHVVAEVFSKENSKWIYIDPQMNIMPTLEGVPLNAVEFQKAILSEPQNIVLINSKGMVEQKLAEFYLNWIGKYLYFFDVAFDQRVGYGVDRKSHDGKTRIMLVPLGIENPTIFQKKYDISSCIYTNSINDFYIVPNE